MPRLIDAEQFYKELFELYQDIGWDERDNHISLADIKCNLELIPTVDPVRHGHIVYRERYIKNYREYTGFDKNGEEHTITVCEDYGSGKEPYCSECGSQLAESFLNYCPNCGAKMDEVE